MDTKDIKEQDEAEQFYEKVNVSEKPKKQKKQNNNNNKLIEELYHTRLHVCDSVKKARKVYSQYSDNPIDLPEIEFDGLTYYNEVGIVIVIFDKNFKELNIEDKLKIIAHESYHVLNRIHEFIGEDSKAEEMNAYMIGYINKYIIQELKLF